MAMEQCESCGAPLPDKAGFCGKCGHVFFHTAQQITFIGDLPTQHLENVSIEDAPTLLTPSHGETPLPLDEEDEDEEKRRRRLALFGFGLPLLGELAQQQARGQIPAIQGTPHLAQIPTLSNAPVAQAGTPFTPGSPAIHESQAPWQAPHHPGHVPPHHPGPWPTHPLPHPHPQPSGDLSGGTTGGPKGCLTIAAIIVAALLIIVATFIGLGLTLLAPNLSLSGNATVAPGGTMTLHGSSFLPNSSVTLTLDNSTPLYVSRPSTDQPLASKDTSHAASMELLLNASLTSIKKNVIPVNGDGSFLITFLANPSWPLGKHTIHATESPSHRSASLPFTITETGLPDTPTATPTETATSTATATGTPTGTPTSSSAPTLSCANPGNLTLGPVRENSSQAATGNITLCTSGTGTLNWTVSWDQTQASWLQLDRTSGAMQAPNGITVTTSASAAKLGAGVYRAMLTFSSTGSSTTQAVAVTFTVVAGCISATPLQLNFTGVAGVSDPAGPQSVTITNCGLAADWSAHIAHGSSWLTISSNQGTLQAGAMGTITVTASNMQAGLKAGSYQDSIAIALGGHTTTVAVSLTVQAPPPPPPLPMISASPDPLNSACSSSPASGIITCTVTLSNSSSSAALQWSASVNDQRVRMPSSGTIPAGGQQPIGITISRASCPNITITFTGPANVASVTWNCPPPPPPMISASPNALILRNCTRDPQTAGLNCPVTLTNSSTSVPLTWSAATSAAGVSVQPGGGTIVAGGTVTVTIVTTRIAACTNFTVTFNGPTNSASVTYTSSC